MKRVIVSGYFNPLHDGHLNLIDGAKEIGDYLIVIVNNDIQQELKKGKIIMDESTRCRIARSLKKVDEVVLSIDKTPTIAKTLETIAIKYPNDELVFANGGDRSDKQSPIPTEEADMQHKYGIELAYGVGGHNKADSSTRINQELGTERKS